LFGTSLRDEYRKAASVLGLGRARLAELAANGVRASFLDENAKKELTDQIAAVLDEAGAAAETPAAGRPPRSRHGVSRTTLPEDGVPACWIQNDPWL
jgi:adenosine deaminase